MRRTRSRIGILRYVKENIMRPARDGRLFFLIVWFVLFGAVILGRLFVLQVARHAYYVEVQARRDAGIAPPVPARGRILVHDMRAGSDVFPVAIDEDVFTVFIDSYLLGQKPSGKAIEDMITDPHRIARIVANKLGIDEQTVYQKLTKPDRAYQVLKNQVPQNTVDELKLENLQGINFERTPFRFYPEGELFSQEVGFFGFSAAGTPTGKYGVEGYLNSVLAGKSIPSALGTDASTDASSLAAELQKGSDVVLTLDRSIQFEACNAIKAHIDEYKAKSASVIIMDVKTGAILAMCNTPDFDPNNYKDTTDLSAFNNNTIFTPYEPGSVFKIITMAAALDKGAITPDTTYTDHGVLHYGRFTIHNAADKSYGVQTMTDVLKESINTGAVFAAAKVGQEVFKHYVQAFGFGALTGVQMDKEITGNISALDHISDLNLATASFGQGITTTPLQLLTAFASVANGGKLMTPRIVDKTIAPDGTIEAHNPSVVRQVISSRAAKLLTGMMVVVVKDGHDKKAQPPGYYVAGKTGTAQISDGTGGYGTGTNQTFIGFAPADNPSFAMLVKYEDPQRKYAEYTAVPVFGEIAQFLLNYLQIPPSYQTPSK